MHKIDHRMMRSMLGQHSFHLPYIRTLPTKIGEQDNHVISIVATFYGLSNTQLCKGQLKCIDKTGT